MLAATVTKGKISCPVAFVKHIFQPEAIIAELQQMERQRPKL
jgi:hypothetical protein